MWHPVYDILLKEIAFKVQILSFILQVKLTIIDSFSRYMFPLRVGYLKKYRVTNRRKFNVSSKS